MLNVSMTIFLDKNIQQQHKAFRMNTEEKNETRIFNRKIFTINHEAEKKKKGKKIRQLVPMIYNFSSLLFATRYRKSLPKLMKKETSKLC